MEKAMRLRCACGWETIGTESELIEATQEHGRRIHNMLPSREEVLAMVIPDDETPGEAGGQESA